MVLPADPNDPWDYDATNTPVQADLTIDGKPRKVFYQAARNGWFYVVDRTDGTLIHMTPFTKVTSVTGYDRKNRIGTVNAALKPKVGTTVFTCPAFFGGDNWWPYAFDPKTGYAFVPTMHTCMKLSGGKPKPFKAGADYTEETYEVEHTPGDPHWGELQAIEVATGRRVWGKEIDQPWSDGSLSTDGGVVFSGTPDQHFYAFDARSGKVLWDHRMHSGVIGVPVSYRVDGRQYVAVQSGWGGVTPFYGGPKMVPGFRHIPLGGRLYVFALPREAARERAPRAARGAGRRGVGGHAGLGTGGGHETAAARRSEAARTGAGGVVHRRPGLAGAVRLHPAVRAVPRRRPARLLRPAAARARQQRAVADAQASLDLHDGSHAGRQRGRPAAARVPRDHGLPDAGQRAARRARPAHPGRARRRPRRAGPAPLNAERIGASARLLVLAPHPDDDVLGCGALLAYAARRGGAARVLYATDGAASHPRSRRYPPAALRALREREACAALRRLGHDPARSRFLRAPDGRLAELAGADARALRAALAAAAAALAPTHVLLPWRRDPHPDHRALAALARAALRRGPGAPRLLEYAVWLNERGTESDRPRSDEVHALRFASEACDGAAKRAALAEHRSQTSALIDDDPSGFRLDPAMAERACANPEIFYEEP